MRRRGFIAALLALPVFLREKTARAYNWFRPGKAVTISGINQDEKIGPFLIHNTGDQPITFAPVDENAEENRFAMDKPHEMNPGEFVLVDWRPDGRPTIIDSGVMPDEFVNPDDD